LVKNLVNYQHLLFTETWRHSKFGCNLCTIHGEKQLRAFVKVVEGSEITTFLFTTLWTSIQICGVLSIQTGEHNTFSGRPPARRAPPTHSRAVCPRHPHCTPPKATCTFPRPFRAPRRLRVSPPRVAPDRPICPMFLLRCAPTKVAVVLRPVLMVH
jgi:hypothetical protein